ncbi:MAG TPA: Ku protein [Povalibacter sp.]
MPSRRRKPRMQKEANQQVAPVRPAWSGTLTFGLVSIPVSLYSAIRPRQTAMKLVDTEGHALGREYHCSKDGKELDQDDLVRGYETDGGKMVVITDEEFAAVAPEMSGDIELRSFVPLEQIPPLYFQRPYFLAPAGKSSKAYHLLAAIMTRTQRSAIGSFVMRGHEYLVAIVAENGVLRADTLRYANEIRSPASIGLPKGKSAPARSTAAFGKIIDALASDRLDMDEFKDEEAQTLQKLAEKKESAKKDVIHTRDLEPSEAEETSAKVIDLMEVLRKSLSKDAVVTTAGSITPIDLAEHRARRRSAARSAGNTGTQRRRKTSATRRS